MGIWSWLKSLYEMPVRDCEADHVPVVDEPRLGAACIVEGRKAVFDIVHEEVERERHEEVERIRWMQGQNAKDSRSANTMRFSIASRAFDEIEGGMIEQTRTFRCLLMRYVNDRCAGKASRCYTRAGVSRQVYSKILSDSFKFPSKRTALQLCIGLKLTYAEAVGFLAAAGYALSRCSYEDMAFAWCLQNSVYSIFDVNELLVLCKCEPITVF